MEEETNSLKKTARMVGILFFVSTTSFLIGAVLLRSVINGPDYLGSLYTTNKFQVSAGVFLQLINDIAVAGIGVLMFRILKKYNENIAVGYLSSRLLEAVILIVGGMSLLVLITISEEYIKGGTTNALYYQTLGTLAKKWHYWSFEIAMITLGLGGFFLCYLLYTSKLVPQLIAVLGIIGYPILFAKMLLDVLGYSTGMILFVPAGIFVGLFELIFPIWLLAKGFNTSPIVADPEN